MLPERVLSHVRSVVSAYGLVSPEELAGCLDLWVLKAPLNMVRGAMVDLDTPFLDALLSHLSTYLGIPLGGISLSHSGLLAVNSTLPYSYQRGVIVHECGHRVMHTGESRFFLEQNTLYLPDRKELEANLFALFYLMEWDKLGLEECGGDLFRFADFYGLPHRATEVAWHYLRKD